jgi:hypothetical protein
MCYCISVDQGHFVQHNAAPVPGAPICLGETALSLNKSGLLAKVRTYFKAKASASADV